MAYNSDIEWTDTTWNPATGCTKVSSGCRFCYAERFAERFRGTPGHPFEQGFDLKLHPDRLQWPYSWKKSRLVFVNSMSDLFHEKIDSGFIGWLQGTEVGVTPDGYRGRRWELHLAPLPAPGCAKRHVLRQAMEIR